MFTVPTAARARAQIVDLLTSYRSRPAALVSSVSALCSTWSLPTIDAATFGFYDRAAGAADVVATAGSAAITSASNPWTSADVGRSIAIAGAGAAAATLVGVIVAVTAPGAATLDRTATTAQAATVAVWGDEPAQWTSPTLSTSAGEAAAGMLVRAPGATTARSAGARAGDTINVRDRGAVGDGLTDDTAAIQAAISEAATVGGGLVDFPRGRYRVTASLLLPVGGITLRGVSNKASVILSDSAAGISVLRAADQDAYNDGWVIEDLGIITAHAADIGVDLTAVSRASLVRVRVWGDELQTTYRGTGVLLDAAAKSCYGNQLHDCDLRALNKCVWIRGAANTNMAYGGQWTLADSVLYQSGTGAARVENCAFFGVRMESLAGACVDLTGEVWSWHFSACRMEVYAPGGVGVRIAGGSAALPPTRFSQCLITASGGGAEWDLSTAVGRVALVGSDVNEYTDLSGAGSNVVGRNMTIGNPAAATATLSAVGSGTDADLALAPKGAGMVVVPALRADSSDIPVSANGATVTPIKAVHTINGNGAARTACVLAAGTPGQMVHLIGYTWSVQIINSTTADLVGGAAVLGNGAGEVAGLTLFWSATTGKWQEVSRSTR